MSETTTTAGKAPTLVVIDTIDGYTFSSDSTGVLFGEDAARAFATGRNAEMKPEYQSYRVFALVPADAGPWRAGGGLAALFTAAEDDEYPAIEEAAIRAGLLFRCTDPGCHGAGVGCPGDLCQSCGAEIKPEA